MQVGKSLTAGKHEKGPLPLILAVVQPEGLDVPPRLGRMVSPTIPAPTGRLARETSSHPVLLTSQSPLVWYQGQHAITPDGAFLQRPVRPETQAAIVPARRTDDMRTAAWEGRLQRWPQRRMGDARKRTAGQTRGSAS